jgi:hypothetical protein
LNAFDFNHSLALAFNSGETYQDDNLRGGHLKENQTSEKLEYNTELILQDESAADDHLQLIVNGINNILEDTDKKEERGKINHY